MRMAIILILVSWFSGVSLAFIRVISSAGFTEWRLPLKELWTMGILPIAAIFGTVISVLLSPLVIWAFKGWDKPHAIFQGIVLFGCLALYFVGSSFIMVWLKHEDVYGIFTIIAPTILAILGLVYIGQVQR